MAPSIPDVAPVPDYESEPGQRRALGSVQVSPDVWWSGSLTLPDHDRGERDPIGPVSIVELTRHAPGDDEQVTLVAPPDEMPVVITLLSRLVADAACGAAHATLQETPGPS